MYLSDSISLLFHSAIRQFGHSTGLYTLVNAMTEFDQRILFDRRLLSATYFRLGMLCFESPNYFAVLKGN